MKRNLSERRRQKILTAALAAGALLALPGSAVAATNCTGLIAGTTINAPVVVPSGAGCVLKSDQVNGSVTIKAGGALSLGGGNTINGSITGTGVQAFDSFSPTNNIGGSFTLTGVSGVPATGPLGISDSENFFDSLHVNGPASVTGGSAAAIWVEANSNTYGGSFTYANNGGSLTMTAPDHITGALTVRGNTGGGTLGNLTVGGSVSCGNTPKFTITAPLTVSGFNAAAGGTC